MANKKHQRLPGLNILHNQSNGHSRNYSVRTVLTLICVGSALQGYGTPGEDSGETDAPVFEEYRIPGTNRILKLERLWERDLSEFSGDADENNHNMFVDGGILYCYLEHYEGGTSRSIILRRFNAETGEMLPEIAVPYPVAPGNNTQLSVQSDDNGNLIIAGILPNANLGRGRLNLSAGTYSHDDADGLHVVGQPIVYERTTGENDASYHYYRGAFEWLDMTQEATGSYQLTVGCWHHYGKFPDDRTPFYPGRLQFSCSPDSPEPEITCTRYAPQAAYGLDIRDNRLTGGSTAEGMLFSQVLSNGLHLVQGFGKSASENTAHTPMMLYGAAEGAPEDSPLEFIEALEAPPFSLRDARCFGAFPVTLDSESLLVLPYKFSENSGARFMIARWNQATFSSLEELWTFPEEKTFPWTNKIYDFLRPKVVVAASGPQERQRSMVPSGADIYAYMPGSGLGAYRLSLRDNTTSGTDDCTVLPDNSRIQLSVSGKRLRIIPETSERSSSVLPVRVLTPDGRLCVQSDVCAAAPTDIDLSQLPAGIYMAVIGSSRHKIVLR